MKAVVTGDIVNSTLLDGDSEKKLMSHLKEILSPYKHEFYRGDSFQAYFPESAKALETALQCRTAAIALKPEEDTVSSDVRLSIGIGEIDPLSETLASSKGQAFLLSGRAFDAMDKTEGRLVISIDNNMANIALGLAADYINSIFKHMTAKQAEVINDLLKGNSQQQVADKLGRSKSTISQHANAGKWDEIENILKKYIKITELISS